MSARAPKAGAYGEHVPLCNASNVGGGTRGTVSRLISSQLCGVARTSRDTGAVGRGGAGEGPQPALGPEGGLANVGARPAFDGASARTSASVLERE